MRDIICFEQTKITVPSCLALTLIISVMGESLNKPIEQLVVLSEEFNQR